MVAGGCGCWWYMTWVVAGRYRTGVVVFGACGCCWYCALVVAGKFGVWCWLLFGWWLSLWRLMWLCCCGSHF